jgi:hypothetical protein
MPGIVLYSEDKKINKKYVWSSISIEFSEQERQEKM